MKFQKFIKSTTWHFWIFPGFLLLSIISARHTLVQLKCSFISCMPSQRYFRSQLPPKLETTPLQISPFHKHVLIDAIARSSLQSYLHTNSTHDISATRFWKKNGKGGVNIDAEKFNSWNERLKSEQEIKCLEQWTNCFLLLFWLLYDTADQR